MQYAASVPQEQEIDVELVSEPGLSGEEIPRKEVPVGSLPGPRQVDIGVIYIARISDKHMARSGLKPAIDVRHGRERYGGDDKSPNKIKLAAAWRNRRWTG